LSALLLIFTLLSGCADTNMRGRRLSEAQRLEDMKHDSSFIYFAGQFLDVLDIPKNELAPAGFIRGESGRVSYSGAEDAVMGIDVSEWQGDIDWAAAAADGVHFVMLRAGRRGYTEGGLFIDERFEEYYAGAKEAGLKVGVYFFSQAITADEAEEEALFLLDILGGRALDLPVAFDWEIPSRDGRTAGLDGGVLTECALRFCEIIESAGYIPMIYSSLTLAYLHYSPEGISQYPFWLAQYAEAPSYRYKFSMWQYSDTGSVAGITGDVDLNLWIKSDSVR